MKKTIFWFAIFTVVLILDFTAFAAERPKPFGLEVSTSTYEECIKILFVAVMDEMGREYDPDEGFRREGIKADWMKEL